MAEASSRTALLEDPQLRPFLPLLWVAWSDGDMEEADLAELCARVAAMPWLRPAARIAQQPVASESAFACISLLLFSVTATNFAFVAA